MVEFDNFEKVDFRIGTILEVNNFPKAKKPAFQLTIDFGPLGILKSSAQLTTQYSAKELQGRQVVAVVNFPEKRIADFSSQCLVLGAAKDNDVFLLSPRSKVKNGQIVR